jgi:hypothetical protein
MTQSKMEETMDHFSYRYAGLTMVDKMAAVSPDSSVYADGFNLPAGENVPFLGICEKGVLPDAVPGYVGGVYAGFSGQPWPVGPGGSAIVTPKSPQGLPRTLQVGPIRVPAIAAGAISRGDRLVIGDASARVASVVTLGYQAGQAINLVGVADTATTAADQVVYIWIAPVGSRHDRV